MFYLLVSVLFAAITVIHSQQPIFAVSTLHSDSGSTTRGFLVFTQFTPKGSIIIRGIIEGLIPNTTYHGFHVHEMNGGNTTTNCTTSGPHFNPYMKSHGAPTDTIDKRHVGDLGNIQSNGFGIAHININDSIIQLGDSVQSIQNRTIVVHRDIDDLGRGGQVDSNTTGHAGPRIACGVIQVIQTKLIPKSWFNSVLAIDTRAIQSRLEKLMKKTRFSKMSSK